MLISNNNKEKHPQFLNFQPDIIDKYILSMHVQVCTEYFNMHRYDDILTIKRLL